MKKTLTYLFALFIVIIGCKTEKQVDIDRLNLGELFTYYINTDNSGLTDSIEQRMYDSILLNPNRFFYPLMEIDTNRNEVSLQFGISEPEYFDYSIKHRNVFAIEIDRQNIIKAKGLLISNFDSLDSDIREFMFNPMNEPHLPEKRLRVLEYFDTVYVCNAAFDIKAQTLPDSLGNKTSWKEIKMVVNHLQQTANLERDKLALSKWNKSFDSLELSQKVAVCKYIPILIWVYPHRELVPPPPPPPPTNQEVIDIIESIEIDEELIFEENE